MLLSGKPPTPPPLPTLPPPGSPPQVYRKGSALPPLPSEQPPPKDGDFEFTESQPPPLPSEQPPPTNHHPLGQEAASRQPPPWRFGSSSRGHSKKRVQSKETLSAESGELELREDLAPSVRRAPSTLACEALPRVPPADMKGSQAASKPALTVDYLEDMTFDAV